MDFSLNMVKVSCIPEYFLLKNVNGKIGFNVFSSETVCNIIKQHANELHINKKCELPKALSGCLESNNIEIRKKAESLVNEFGRRLALVLYNAKIVSNNENNSENEKNEDEEKFKKCTKLLIGGGLASGELGKNIIKNANDALKQTDQDLELFQFAFPAYMPLIGCSSLADNGKTFVFDFGQTYIKSAVAYISEFNIEELKIHKKIPSNYAERYYTFNFIKKSRAKKLDNYIKNYILDILSNNHEFSCNEKIIISFAGKVQNNELLPYGAYGKLEAVFGHYRENLEKFISKETNKDIKIILINDETAAALASNHFDGLVVTLGTAFGLGNPQNDVGFNDFSEIKISH